MRLQYGSGECLQAVRRSAHSLRHTRFLCRLSCLRRRVFCAALAGLLCSAFFGLTMPVAAQAAKTAPTTTTIKKPPASAPTVVQGSVTSAQARLALTKLQGKAGYEDWLAAYAESLVPSDGGALILELAPKAVLAARPGLLARAGALFLIAGRMANAGDAFLAAADAVPPAPTAKAASAAQAAAALAAAASNAVLREEFLVKAARCRLALGDTAAARAVAARLVVGARNKITLDRSALISAWAFLVEALPADAFTLARDIASGAPKTSEERKEALFVQWLAAKAMTSAPVSTRALADAEDLKKILVAEYPGSAEAGIASGRLLVASVPWLTLNILSPEAAQSAVMALPVVNSERAALPSTSDAPLPPAAASTQTTLQAGWFSRKQNADALLVDLKKLGFKVSVEEQKTKDGELRWAVLVDPEGDWSKMQARLKDAGYESYPSN